MGGWGGTGWGGNRYTAGKGCGGWGGVGLGGVGIDTDNHLSNPQARKKVKCDDASVYVLRTFYLIAM